MSPELIVTLLVVVLVIFFIVLWRRRKKDEFFDRPIGTVKFSEKSRQTTREGVTVYGEKPISQQLLDLIDEGVTEEFSRAIGEGGYENALDHSFYDVYIPVDTCEPSPVTRTMSFAIRGDATYDGTEWDYAYKKKIDPPREIKDSSGNVVKILHSEPDGRVKIYAAEMIKSLGTPGSTITRAQLFVCDDIGVIKEGVKAGVQHIILAHNNPVAFWDTIYHLTSGHPLPYPPAVKSLEGDVKVPTGKFIIRCQ